MSSAPLHRSCLRGLFALGGTMVLSNAVACAPTAPHYPTRLKAPEVEPRRPPGVAVLRPFAEPTPDAHDERALVLVPPIDTVEAKRLIDAFLEAVRTENAGALDRLLAQGAVQQLGGGREVRSAREYWQRRLTRLDYAALADGALYRPQDLRILRAEDPEPSGAQVELPLRPRHSGEMALTLPLLITHAGSVRLFGPELAFLVVEEGDRLVIARIWEDFQLL